MDSALRLLTDAIENETRVCVFMACVGINRAKSFNCMIEPLYVFYVYLIYNACTFSYDWLLQYIFCK